MIAERIENYFTPSKLAESRLLDRYLAVACLLAVSGTLFFVFCVVPDERVMGPVQRIFYFHVGAAMATYVASGLLLLGSVLYLSRRHESWDVLGEAAAAVGFAFASIVLATGMIWGHSAWNVWWRWEPRLISFLVLWMMLLGLVLLRKFAAEHPLQRNYCAILGILSAINVPIVVFSVKLLAATEQLHPQVVANQGLKDPSYVYTLIGAIIAVSMLAIWMIGIGMQTRIVTTEAMRQARFIRNPVQ